MTAKKVKAPTAVTVEAFEIEPTKRARFTMKDTTAKAKRQGGDLPTSRQARNLSLKMVRESMATLSTVREADKDFGGGCECDADSALDLARKELDYLHGTPELSEMDFLTSWWRISSVVTLAGNSFKRDCLFKTYIQGLVRDFTVLGEMIEQSEEC